MAAAARLAVAGHRVVVYERAATYGGAVGRFERDGFAFDTGPGLLQLPAVYRDLFVKTGKEPLEECVELVQVDPAAGTSSPTARTCSLPNASRAGVVAALDDGARRGRRASAGASSWCRAREAWDRTRRPLLEEPLWPDWQVLAERDPYPAVQQRRLLRTRRGRPRSPRSAPGSCATPGSRPCWRATPLAYGLDPRDRPGGAAVLPYMEHDLRHLVRARRDAGAGAGGVRAVPGAEGGVRLRRRGRPGSSRRTAGRRAWSWPTARSSRRTRGRGRGARSAGPADLPGSRCTATARFRAQRGRRAA